MTRKQKLNDLKLKTKKLGHRNTKQKDALMTEVNEYLTKYKIPDESIKQFKLITFEYVELYKGWHSPKRFDETWKKAKYELEKFLETIK